MVFGYVGASVLGAAAVGAGNWDMFSMAAGLVQSGRGAQVDQAFQRRHDRIDYKAQRQGLHRDDISDLMSLTTGRMDMYNLVGALLLTFALQWITSSDIVVASNFGYWPHWYSTVFVISCFSAVGYLLFSLWFAMHCSLVVQALGTRLRLNFARLSLPANPEISKLKVPFYIPGGAMEKMQNKFFSGSTEGQAADIDIQEALEELRKGEEDDSVKDMDATPSAWIDDGGVKNDSNSDFELHLRRWLRERGQWLSADAYARACMFVGMNQLLQALTYHVVATVWKVSVLTALMCLILSKMLSIFILMIDLGRKHYSCLGMTAVALLEVLPPCYAMLVLFVYTPGVDWGDWAEGLVALPVFLLHAAWMMYLSGQLAPTVRTRTTPIAANSGTGESDSDDSSDSDDDPDASRYRRMNGLYGTEFLPKKLRATKFHDIIRLEQPTPPEELEERHPPFDHLPGKLSRSFTKGLAALWVLAGVVHVLGKVAGVEGPVIVTDSNSTASESSGSWTIWPHARPRPHTSRTHTSRVRPRRLEGAGEARRLEASWPQPASFFKVMSLNCGTESQMFVQSDFASYAAEKASHGLGIGNLTRLALPGGRSSVLCSAQHGCAALAAPRRSEGGDFWGFGPLELSVGTGQRWRHTVENVSIPAAWSIVSAAWDEVSCSSIAGGCTSAWAAGWDGSGVVIATLQKDVSSQSWILEQSFKVTPGAGLCAAGPEICDERPEGSYDDVQALQVGPGGLTLAVLHSDGLLDAWGLQSGTFLGQWDLGNNYRAMCHDSTHLHLARQEDVGPVLEAMQLPVELQFGTRSFDRNVVPVEYPLASGALHSLRR